MPHLRRSVRWTLAVLAALVALPASASAAGPPTVTTSPVDPSLLTDTYGLIGGVINPKGVATSYQFEWGTTTAYGQTTPVTSAANGTAEVPVDFSLDALTPVTTYHYRLVAWATADPANRILGADQAFTTTRSLAVSVPGHKAKLKGKKASFKLKAVGPPDTTADGIATIKAVVGKQVKTLALKTYSVATGTKKTFKVTLPASIRKLLAEKGHPKVLLRVSAKTSGIKHAVVKNLKVAR
jgi:hypothetical protein